MNVPAEGWPEAVAREMRVFRKNAFPLRALAQATATL
jgi:hypothetical protein